MLPVCQKDLVRGPIPYPTAKTYPDAPCYWSIASGPWPSFPLHTCKSTDSVAFSECMHAKESPACIHTYFGSNFGDVDNPAASFVDTEEPLSCHEMPRTHLCPQHGSPQPGIPL